MKNNKSIYIVGIFMLVTMVSIGYAILTGQLNINGTAKVKAASWNIYFKNIKIKDGSVTASVVPAISNKTTVNFEVDLNKPGDFYEFNVDVVNDGDLDAMIESISITPELTLDQQKYLNYTVTYADGVVIEEKDILHAQKTRTLKVKVEYLKNISNNELVLTEETINVHVEIKYVQADNTAKESTSLESDKPVFKMTKITGDGTQLGDELAIGNEHFYVISNDGNKIVMLAKYNLLVGNVCTNGNESSCTPLTNPTGIQDETAIAYYNNSNPRIGTVKFSESKYWGNVAQNTYVYNDNSNVKQYVDNYQRYLEGLGAYIIEARLITDGELVSLGCSSGNSGNCKNTPNWVRSTTYWSGSYSDGDYMRGVDVLGNSRHYYYNIGIGVRPVIVVPASSI